MADKFRATFPIPVTFAEGEQPTNKKLNAVSTQARNGSAILERAIGDIWNQSGDANTSNFPLHIASLARAVGDQSLLNSKLPLPDLTGVSLLTINQNVTVFRGKTEILLNFSPASATDVALNAAMAASPFGYTTRVATRDLIDSDVKWSIDLASGTIYLGKALDPSGITSLTLDYGVSSLPSDASNASGFSFIPHPLQQDWNGLKIVFSGTANKYHLVLPFRRPINPVPDSKLPTQTNNEASIGSPLIIRYWGPSPTGYAFTSGVSNARVYRYLLPQIASTLFLSPVAGTLIPTGVVYLWDNTTETIVEGLTYKVPDLPLTLFGTQVPWVIQVEGVGLDELFSGYTSVNNAEAPSHYQNRFSLIGVGQSLAQAVEALREELIENSAATSFSKRINHSDLAGNSPAQGTRFSFAPPPSYVAGDDHSYLLSRVGSSVSSGAYRDRYNNGMLGDLLLLGADKSENITVNSNKIVFNNISTGASLGYLVNQTTLPNGISGALSGDIVNSTNKGNSIYIDNYPLRVARQTLILGDNDGLTYTSNGQVFRFFANSSATGNGFVNQAKIGAGTLYLYNSSYDISAIQTPDSAAEDLAQWSKYTGTRVTFKGTDFSLATNTGGTQEVIIGTSGSTTYLRIRDNRIYWDTFSGDYIEFNNGTETWSFIADGGSATSTIAVDNIDVDTVDVATSVTVGVGTTLATSSVSTSTVDAHELDLDSSLSAIPSGPNILSRGLIPKAWAVIQLNPDTILSSVGFDLTYNGTGLIHDNAGEDLTLRFERNFTSIGAACPIAMWGISAVSPYDPDDVIRAQIYESVGDHYIELTTAGAGNDFGENTNRFIVYLVVFGLQ